MGDQVNWLRADFNIPVATIGMSQNSAIGGETVGVVWRAVLGPFDPDLNVWLRNLHGTLVAPSGVSRPWTYSCVVIVVRPDLSCVLYASNTPVLSAKVRVDRTVSAGDPVYDRDLSTVESATIGGIVVPDDCGYVCVLTREWSRSLSIDFEPLLPERPPRSVPFERSLGLQVALLYAPPFSNVASMHLAVGELRRLLSSRCVTEESYQSLLASNPWILGAQFEEVMSHPVLDDENVPDFAVRLPGSMHWNLVEIKQPFLPIFRKDGGFSTHLNAAWEQADRYVRFTKDERRYLRDRKHLSFHDTRCTLVVGYDCTDAERRRLADRAATSTCVEVQTWRELLTRAEAYLAKVEDAHRQQVWDRSSSAESRDESST